MLENVSEELKKIFLFGVGAVATTAEKSKVLIDDLVAKGELSMEEGKVFNEELKHQVKETLHTASAKAKSSVKKATEEKTEIDLENMNEDELNDLKEKIERIKMKKEASEEVKEEDLSAVNEDQ